MGFGLRTTRIAETHVREAFCAYGLPVKTLLVRADVALAEPEESDGGPGSA